MHVIPDAGHPAYLDNPMLWNTMLHNFMHLDCVKCDVKTSKRSASDPPQGWGDADFGPDL